MKKAASRVRVYLSEIQKNMFFLAFMTAFAAAFTQTLAVLIDKVIVCVFYGEAEIAAVSLANPFFYLLEIPATGLAAGLQIVCSKELGAGEIDRVNRLFGQVFLLAAAVLPFLTVLSFLYVDQMAFLFGARGKTAELQPFASRYLFGLSFEILPYVLFCLMTPIVTLDNGGTLLMIASLCGCLTDIVLDLLSVKYGWGLLGIGLASSASAVVYFLVTMLHFLNRDRVIRLRFVRFRPGGFTALFHAAAPKALLSLSDALCSAVLISLVSVTGGVSGTCALSIHGTVSYTITIFAAGIAGAVGILAGICCGEKNGEELEGVGVLAHRYCLILSAGIAAILALCARPLSSAVTESRASAELLGFALFCLMLTTPFSFLVQARISYLQAVGRTRNAQRMGIFANLLFPVAGAGLLALLFGVRGAFLAFPAAQILVLLVSWISHRKQTGKAFPPARAYLEVDDSFHVSPGDVISYPVETKEDCALASEQLMLFCRGHRLEERTGFLAGLCLEELTTNVIEHGLTPRQAIRTADVRIVIDGRDVILRVRDRGAAFNLKRFADRLLETERAPSAPGLRILLHSAKSVSYYRTYGLNTTILRIQDGR